MKSAEAVREWRRLAPILWTNKLLNEGNIGLLAQLCAVHAHLVTIWRRGSKAKPNAALVATYRMLSNSLGLLNWDIPIVKPGNRFADNAFKGKRGSML